MGCGCKERRKEWRNAKTPQEKARVTTRWFKHAGRKALRLANRPTHNPTVHPAAESRTDNPDPTERP